MRLDSTNDDLSLTVNGIHIVRVHNNRLDQFGVELSRPETVKKLKEAYGEYSDFKVSELLEYDPVMDHRLPTPIRVETEKDPPTGHYLFSQIMSLDRSGISKRFGERVDNLVDHEFSSLKYEMTRKLCVHLGVNYPEEVENGSRTGINYKSILRQIKSILLPLQEFFEKINLDNETKDSIFDDISRRYSPDAQKQIEKNVQKIALMFNELYLESRRYGFYIPKQRELLAFFRQISKRVLGKETSPLKMLMVTCPRYNEDKLSETANAYLITLPHITYILAKYGIPFTGYILVDDAEERVASGLYLSRLCLTSTKYREECKRNVDVVREMVAKDNRMVGISAHPLGNIFPDFVNVVSNLQKQFYRLTLINPEFKLVIAKVADARLPKHTKILGGRCDFSDSFYLALHYSAEYMALGYLCRLYPELSEDSFIVNYNSPNIGQFNNNDLLAQCIKGDISPNDLKILPTFQVKLY